MSMFNKQLKPLNHKKSSNQSQPTIKKEPLVKDPSRGIPKKPSNEAKRLEEGAKGVRLEKGGARSTKTV